MKQKQRFVVGDHVTLFEQDPDSQIANNPVMVVTGAGEEGGCSCSWFDSNNQLQNAWFDQKLLYCGSSRFRKGK